MKEVYEDFRGWACYLWVNEVKGDVVPTRVDRCLHSQDSTDLKFRITFQFKRLTVQLGTPDGHHVELLVKQGQHVFTLHVLLHVGYTFIV